MNLCFDPWVIGPWVAAQSGWQWVPYSSSAIGRVKDGEVIGGVLYESMNGASVTMHVAGIGLHWINRELLWAAFDYPFRQLKVRKVLAPIGSGNKRSIRLVERLGFVREAVLTDASPSGDMYLYTMAADKCRWLELRKP